MGRFSKNDGFAAKNSRINISTLSSALAKESAALKLTSLRALLAR